MLAQCVIERVRGTAYHCTVSDQKTRGIKSTSKKEKEVTTARRMGPDEEKMDGVEGRLAGRSCAAAVRCVLYVSQSRRADDERADA